MLDRKYNITIPQPENAIDFTINDSSICRWRGETHGKDFTRSYLDRRWLKKLLKESPHLTMGLVQNSDIWVLRMTIHDHKNHLEQLLSLPITTKQERGILKAYREAIKGLE